MKKTILTLSIIISSTAFVVFGGGVDNTIEISSKKNADDTHSAKIGDKRNFNKECLDYNPKQIRKITNQDAVNNENDLNSLYEFLVNDDSINTQNKNLDELHLDHRISVINLPKDKGRNNKPLTDAQKKLLQHTDQIFTKDSANINLEQSAKHLKQLWDPSDKKTFAGLSTALLLLSKHNTIKEENKNYLIDLSSEAKSIDKNNPLKAEQQKLLQHAEGIFPKDSANINWEQLAIQLKQLWDPSDKKTFSGLSSALLFLSKNNNINQNNKNYLLDLSKEAYFIYKNEEVKNKDYL